MSREKLMKMCEDAQARYDKLSKVDAEDAFASEFEGFISSMTMRQEPFNVTMSRIVHMQAMMVKAHYQALSEMEKRNDN